MYAIVDGEEVRRVLMNKSRYAVYFYIRADEIEIVAVWHTARGSGPPL